MPHDFPLDGPVTAPFLDSVLRTMGSAVLVFTREGAIRLVNEAAERLLGRPGVDLVGRSFLEVFEIQRGKDAADLPGEVVLGPEFLLTCGAEMIVREASGEAIPVNFNASPLTGTADEFEGVVCVCADIRERKRLELELRHAQKLESVGELAAGIAHEINTPIQFIGDSVSFLRDAFGDLFEAVTALRGLEKAPPEQRMELIEGLCRTVRDVDLDFLVEEIPEAIERVYSGVGRVADIVRAIKVFAHPGHAEPSACDLNEAVRTTLIVARNEYKYVADVQLDLADIPEVFCNQGDLGQVVLNLIVNAAHAVSDRRRYSTERGRISIATHCEADDVILEVTDDGAGIPEEIRDRIFDPFFTTKAPGRGTGQGLAILHRVVAQKYGGAIAFESEVGKGTTFRVSLPVCVPPSRRRDLGAVA
jgi:PAS domain S-box-containing protein